MEAVLSLFFILNACLAGFSRRLFGRRAVYELVFCVVSLSGCFFSGSLKLVPPLPPSRHGWCSGLAIVWVSFRGSHNPHLPVQLTLALCVRFAA